MRTSGILMPVFSLGSKYGIGTLGREAYRFVDFLKKSGQTYWQMLPVGTTGFGDSPYQSFSAYAGNPYFIDLDMLVEEKLLKTEEIEALEWGKSSAKVDYEILYKNRFLILRKAHGRFKKSVPQDYGVFCKFNAYWLDDYALFMAIKDSLNGASFDVWRDGLKFRVPEYIKQARTELCDDIDFYKMQQYLFYRQWTMLKKYANKNGVYIIGDIPIYAAYDSADVWASPEHFLLDENLCPTAVAGCPPDAFSDDGQLWGNPLYDWDYMEKDGYRWWLNRIGYAVKLYDVVRIDHFRGFSAFYSIPYGDKTAANGKWVKGPGEKLFDAVFSKLGRPDIIAEDLGTLDGDVHSLLKYTGFPGMKVLQFAFDPGADSAYLPHNITKNSVVYTGTHDNDTAMGFLDSAPESELEFMRKYLRISNDESFNWAIIKSAMATVADTAIFQMQDFLGLDNSARINTPSVPEGNWQWRIDSNCINDWLAGIIFEITKLYRRLPQEKII